MADINTDTKSPINKSFSPQIETNRNCNHNHNHNNHNDDNDDNDNDNDNNSDNDNDNDTSGGFVALTSPQVQHLQKKNSNETSILQQGMYLHTLIHILLVIIII